MPPGRVGTPLAHLLPTVVASVHLDATSEDKRVKQLVRCLKAVRELAGGRDAMKLLSIVFLVVDGEWSVDQLVSQFGGRRSDKDVQPIL